MAELKTKPTEISVNAFLETVEPDIRQRDARALIILFRRVTGWEPQMWGPSIIGFGRYRYLYESGHSGEMCATGFSPRKAELVLYVLGEQQDTAELLPRLGKHRHGKSCLYLKRLADIDEAVLEEIIRAGLADLSRRWPVEGS